MPPWIGCQHSTGSLRGARHQRQLLQRVAAVGNFGRQGVILALVRPGFFVERLEDDVYLLFKHLAVGVLVLERRAEALHLAGVIAASHAEDDAPAGQYVGGGEVLGQTQRMPHGGDVEAAAEFEIGGLVGKVDIEHQQVGDALVPFRLEVVLGHPHGVVAVLVHGLGDGLSLGEDGGQMVVVKHAVVDCGAGVADAVHVDVAGVQAVELGNHGRFLLADFV